jgi:cell fate regulator YaaT (PSP1 superfamily)
MSEDRVDFRDLVRDLAHDFHTRIEMHQVGARDEARLVADYEICGRECCCKNFLKTLRPVSMRMAKLQKATLDPAKVSGRCGRLRCCLRYEHEGYEELNKKLPRLGLRVRTDRGAGTIRDRQILTQLLTIEYDSDGLVETVGLEEVVEQNVPMPEVGEQRPVGDRIRRVPGRHRRPPVQPAIRHLP